MGRLYQSLFSGWCFSTNSSFHPGGRVNLAWNVVSFHVDIVAMSAQFIHFHIQVVSNKQDFYYTFVYAHNEAKKRESLWRDMEEFALKIDKPWAILGDFNCVLNMERIGAVVREAEMLPFRMCVTKCGVEDMKSTGCFYT